MIFLLQVEKPWKIRSFNLTQLLALWNEKKGLKNEILDGNIKNIKKLRRHSCIEFFLTRGE